MRLCRALRASPPRHHGPGLGHSLGPAGASLCPCLVFSLWHHHGPLATVVLCVPDTSRLGGTVLRMSRHAFCSSQQCGSSPGKDQFPSRITEILPTALHWHGFPSENLAPLLVPLGTVVCLALHRGRSKHRLRWWVLVPQGPLLPLLFQARDWSHTWFTGGGTAQLGGITSGSSDRTEPNLTDREARGSRSGRIPGRKPCGFCSAPPGSSCAGAAATRPPPPCRARATRAQHPAAASTASLRVAWIHR